MILDKNLTKDQLKKALKEYKAYINAKKRNQFIEEYGIVDEGNIVSEDELITDEKLADKED